MLDLVKPATLRAVVRHGSFFTALVFLCADVTTRLEARHPELVELFEDPPRVLLPAAHPLAGAPAVTVADLAEETWRPAGA